MTVPSHFQDLINRGLYSYADFAYGYMELVIVGEEMPFAELDGWTPSAAEYANAFAYANGIQNPVVDRNSFVTVYYEMPDSENNTTWGWLAAFYCYDSGIWSVQCRCPADVFSEKESDFLSYLYSVAIEAQ